MSTQEIRKAYRANGIIKHLADYLCERKEKWTRADLTEHLKKFGIEASGDEVSEMVFCIQVIARRRQHTPGLHHQQLRLLNCRRL